MKSGSEVKTHQGVKDGVDELLNRSVSPVHPGWALRAGQGPVLDKDELDSGGLESLDQGFPSLQIDAALPSTDEVQGSVNGSHARHHVDNHLRLLNAI